MSTFVMFMGAAGAVIGGGGMTVVNALNAAFHRENFNKAEIIGGLGIGGVVGAIFGIAAQAFVPTPTPGALCEKHGEGQTMAPQAHMYLFLREADGRYVCMEASIIPPDVQLHRNRRSPVPPS